MGSTKISCCVAFLFIAQLFTSVLSAKQVAYIYGDVAGDGTIPSGGATPYDQMLLTATGNKGCSEFRLLVESQAYSIAGYYDATTTLNASFLNQFDVIVFGLHQKIWSAAEKTALDIWLRAGGGMLVYSDSAAGGHYGTVGISNTTGKIAVNNLVSQYGLEVTVDQGGGTRSYIPNTGSPNPIIWDQPEFEGEGVSPVAVSLGPVVGAQPQVLIPLSPASRVNGGSDLNISDLNISFSNWDWAAIALSEVGDGNVIAIFDRQPMWNPGSPGSDIEKEDNKEILRRIIRYLARDYGNSEEWLDLGVTGDPAQERLDLVYRQWSGGTGVVGVDYTARKNVFRVEYKTQLDAPSWLSDASLVTTIGSPVDNGDETETVTVRLLPPAQNDGALFARVAAEPSLNVEVSAGIDRYIGESGQAILSGSASSGGGALTTQWSRVTGPGTVVFANDSAQQTTATFSAPGIYELALTATNGPASGQDITEVRVIADADVVKAINCGNLSSGHVGSNGFTYEADTLFSNGNTDDFPGNAVSNTEDDLLYNYARSGHSNYTIPVANGVYTVYLQFAETYFSQDNKRVFDAFIEGVPVLDDLDLYVTAPGKWVAYDRTFTTTVSDGNLVIGFTASVNNALLNALVVVKH
ncbi:MAG: malectin [Opitutaceae bacterium]